MHESMRRRGAEFGLLFGEYSLMPNTHPALAAAEYARDQGRFEVMHDALFKAYFGAGRDLGDLSVLSDLAEQCDLDPVGLRSALGSRSYDERLAAIRREGVMWMLQGIPLFVVNGAHTITGAQPLPAFRELFSRVAG
jgi:predicted DsbA family dithiol-disulfide isomerase